MGSAKTREDLYMEASVVYKIIAEQMGIPLEEITRESTFSDLGADSLDIFQIVSALEEEFDLEFESDDTDNIKTVGDVIDYLKTLVE